MSYSLKKSALIYIDGKKHVFFKCALWDYCCQYIIKKKRWIMSHSFSPEMASDATTEHPEIKIFFGGHAPKPP